MLPTPLIRDWSRSARLIPVRRFRSLAANSSSSNAGSSGSGAMCAMTAGSTAPPGEKDRLPNVRWSTNRRSSPPSVNVNLARTCAVSGRPGAPITSWPLIPRCTTSASPGVCGVRSCGLAPRTCSHRYLPRRRASPTVPPRRAAAKSSGPAACRLTARGCSTCASAMVRPLTCCWRPFLTVSTSGSSGTVTVRHVLCQVRAPRGFVGRLRRGQVAGRSRAGIAGGHGLVRGRGCRPAGGEFGRASSVRLAGGNVVARRADPGADHRPRGLSGLLLGFLLGPPLAFAPDLAADLGDRPEGLLVIGPALLDRVLRAAEILRSGELLERGLPVQAGAEASGPGDHRVEEPVHERIRCLHAPVEVDGTYHGLERVSEYRRLVAPAGALLALAETDVTPEAQAARDARKRAAVHHGRPQLGKVALWQLRVLAKERVCDDQAEHGIAEELEPLVCRQAAILVGERPVHERAVQ